VGYATLADLIARFGEQELVQLTNRDNPGDGLVVTEVADEALADAESEVNSYLASRYALPLVEVPRVLVRVTCDVARYGLYGSVSADDTVKERYQDAIKFLRDVSTGKATLGIAAPQEAAPVQSGGPEVAPGRRGFSAEHLEGYL
jgi:phage gp36-like protein